MKLTEQKNGGHYHFPTDFDVTSEGDISKFFMSKNINSLDYFHFFIQTTC
jgi:hypothetical protein